MVTNSEIEMRWVEAWSELYELLKQCSDVKYLLPNGRVVDIEKCKGWLQDSAYQGWHVKVEAGWVLDKQGIVASRWLN